ncbi:ATP-binding protein [Ewingella sp. S1.OA.A_B6]
MKALIHAGWLLIFLFFFTPLQAASPPLHLANNLNLPTDVLLNGVKNPWRGKTLHIGILSDNTSPYNILIDNDYYGLNADYLSYVQQAMGITLDLRGYPSLSALQSALNQGDIDLFYGVPLNAMPPGMWASKPYYISPLRVLRSRQNSRQIMVNSRDAQIAISKMTGMQAFDRISKLTPDVHLFDNNLQAVYSLLNGKSDYLIADEASASFILDQLQLGQIYRIESALDFGNLSFVFASNDPALLEVLNQTIATTPMEVMNTLQGRWNKPIPSYLDAGNASLTPLEERWVQQHRRVPYAATENNYPFVYRGSDGEPHGYVVDILNIIAQNTGLTFEPVWGRDAQQADKLVSQEKALFRAVLPLSPDSRGRYLSSMPFHRSLWGVYIRQSSEGVSTWQDLQGKRIGVIRGDLAAALVPANDTRIEFNNVQGLYDALARGQIDALVDNIVSANFISLSRYAGAIKLAFAANNISYPISFGVGLHSPFLLSILDKNLQQIPPQTLQSLRDEWTSDRRNVIDAVNDNRMQPQTTWLLSLLAAVVAILVLILARRLWLLRRERRREREARARLELARQQAEMANRNKSQFLATLSHELRTPMHAILGLLELELQRQFTPGENLPLIYSSASSLMNLLNDLQDYARLDTGTLTLSPKPMSSSTWMTQLTQLYPPLIAQRPVIFDVKPFTPLPDMLMIDSDRLMQVMNNLIGNAIKFTAQGKISVGISWREDARRGELLDIVVSDTGCGIEPQEIDKLFEPYYRGKGAQLFSVQGSGLGLSVCKEIVETMAGTLYLNSLPDIGTEVRVIFPAPRAFAVKQHVQPDKSQPLSENLRVAVIDDHPTNLLLMQRQLSTLGITASLFDSGRAFLRAHAQTPFGLLFVDYNMPHPDGITLAKLVRRQERQNPQPLRIQIVLCSADVQEFTRMSLRHLDVQHCLTKPISLADIRQVLLPAPAPFSDLPERLAHTGNQDQQLIARLIQTLQLTMDGDLRKAEIAKGCGDFSALKDAIHRIKGSLLILGYPVQAALCQEAIEECHQGNISCVAYNKMHRLSQDLLNKLSMQEAASSLHPVSLR